MKKIKRILAIILSITMVMCSTLSSFASENDALQEITESKIVEQLKIDLGEERTNEILNVADETIDGNVEEDILSSCEEEPEEETSMGEFNEPEEDDTRTGEISEQEEDIIIMDEFDEAEENVEESTSNYEENESELTEEFEYTDGIGYTLFESIATSSELDSENEIIELDEKEVKSIDSLLGAGEPWMWWYLTDEGHTIHYTNTEPATGGTAINATSIEVIDEVFNHDQIQYEGLNENNITKAVFDNDIVALTTNHFFTSFSNLSEIEGLDKLNTSNVKSMNSMFYDCGLESLDLTSFDTSNVRDMTEMFASCINLRVLNVNNFDTSKVTCMRYMFNNCAVQSLDLRNFDTSNVTDMAGMFWQENADSLGDWNWLSEIKIDNSFSTSKVTNMAYMFADCKYLENINVDNFDTSNVTSMHGMFRKCNSLTSINVSNFETNNVNDMSAMFSACHSLTSIDVSNFETNNVTTMSYMFNNCRLITSLNLSHFNTSNVTSMSNMFHGCGSLTSIDVSSFDTSNVTDMSSMFSCYMDDDWYTEEQMISSLTEIIGLNSFDTSNVTYMHYMFLRCKSLTSLDLSSFNTENVTSMSGMFKGCINIVTLDLSSFNTRSLSSMEAMFAGLYNYVSNMYIMAEEMKLKTIYVSNSFDTSHVPLGTMPYYNFVFYGCHELVGGNGTRLADTAIISKEYARIDGGPTSATPGYFTFAGGGAPTLSSITVNTPPTKVKYKVGETFDPTGLKINLNYSDSSTDTVTYNATTSANFTFNPSTAFDIAGSSIQVTITYGGKSCTQNVEVIAPQSIMVKTAPSKLKYAIGETFNPTGLKINLVYSDTTTVEEVAYAGNESDFSFNPSGSLNTAGASIPITITYTKNGNNFNCTQNVEVVELSSISINTPPSKTRYIKGANFDPTGLKINLNYSDSSTEIVTYNTTTSVNFTFNGASTLTLNTVGNPFEITIGYAGKTCIQNVIVAELSSIAITTHATKLNYNAGETFDPSGLVITLTYSDSVTEPVAYNTTTSSDFEFSPTGALTRTGNVITVTYGGKTTTETLNVKELTGITIATNPTKLSYSTGQTLNPNGLVLTLTFTDSNNVNTTENVTYNSTTQSKFAFNPSGTAITTGNVTVTYDGKTGAGMQPTFAIIVRTVASISVINIPSKTSYSSGEKLAPSGLSIKVNYADGTNETIAYSSSNSGDFSFNPSTSTSLNTGHTNVTVTYGGKSTSFAISVTQSSGGYVPSSGGGNNSGGGGGGGGGGGIPAGTNPQNNSPTTTQVSSSKSISGIADSSTSTWATDPTTGKWKLNITLGNGQVAPATNGFFMLTNTVTQVVNNVPIQTQVNNTYYFDAQGNMVTGWVQTADNKWFFFDNAKTADEGKMSLGWKQVQGSWYYFTPDGSMMENGITPDGFVIGADGKWVG